MVNKLIISLTTIPTRIDKIANVLESLLNQTIKADMIYINIPKKYSRFSECAKVPDFITNKYNDRVKIFYLEEDYGPATKFIGSLLNPDISDKDIILITDDDIENGYKLYNKHIEDLPDTSQYAFGMFT